MTTGQHPNSRVVTIYRAGSFLARSQGPDIQEYFGDARPTIGSYFNSKSSNRVGSGMEFWEEELLMPYLIEVDLGDREFRKKVSEFFENISTPVPNNTGTKLEIGLLESNDKPLSKENKPINIADYVRYRHALKHPHVAATKLDADSSAIYQYYIVDLVEVQASREEADKEKDMAMQVYLEIKKDPTKVDMLLTLLGHDPRVFTGADRNSKKIAKLRDLAEKDSISLLKVYQDKDFETSYLLKAMIDTQVIKQMGVKYVDAANGKVLANSKDEMVFWLKDDENSDIVSGMKGLMQEQLLNPPKEVKRKTQMLAK